MSLWDKLKGELVDIIEWTNVSSDTMVYRFERYQNEIKYGARLTVRESQVAVFVEKGQIADVFQPGMYQLTTDNIPILSTIKGWIHGFNSPFKAEIYFVSTRNFTDLKWGTKNPIMLRDPEFGAVRLRTFGTYVIRVEEAVLFIKEIVGTDGLFTLEKITDQLKNLIVSRFADVLGECKIPILDMAANYDELSDFITKKIAPEFKEYGLDITKLLVENITLPPEVEKMLDKRTSMGIVGNLDQYSKFQTANAMEEAAKNPGGGASEGIGMGMGFGMANQMAKANMQTQAPVPPPLPQAVQFYVGVDGKQTGPYDKATIINMIKSNTLTKETLIWKQGMAGWVSAGATPELANLFSETPPPLPK